MEITASELKAKEDAIFAALEHADPEKEHVSEETSEEVVLVKDKDGKLIGFEVLNFLSADEARDVTVVPVEAAVS